MSKINDTTGKSRQTVQSSHPGWMAHWMRNDSNLTVERRDGSAYGNKELDLVSMDDHITLEASGSVKDHGKLIAYTESVGMSSKGLGDEGICSAQLKHGQGTDHNLNCGTAINGKGGIQLSSGVMAANESSLREYRSSTEGTSKKPIKWVKSHFSAKDRSSSSSMSSQERFGGPSKHIVPYHDPESYKFDKGKAVVCHSVSRPSIVSSNHLPDAKLKVIGQEHCQKHFQSADLIWEKRKVGSQSEPDTSMDVCFGDRNTSWLLDAPSMNDHYQPKSGGYWFQKMQKSQHIISSPPSQCIASEKNEQKMSSLDPYPFKKLPSCVNEQMRICNTVDSVEGTPGDSPWFSQTTHSLLITKNTDVDVSKETNIFRRLITQMNANSSSGLENTPPFFGQANRGVKLQAISSSNSEGQGNIGDFGIGTYKVTSKNESSADTDTMDMEFWKEERLNSGENSTRSTKVSNFDNNLSPHTDVASSRDIGCGWRSSRIPDIKLELPALPAVASSSEDIPTSSRTQSLEMDTLLAQAEKPEPKSNIFLHDSPKVDPSARWVKRLKLSSSDSTARGTRSSNLAETSSHDKKRKSFTSILNKGITSSETTPKEVEVEHLTLDPPKKSKELLLSHVWIKRWLTNETQISQKKPDAVVVCEPRTLKSSVDDDLQKKQFPSIAAMALMGKSMTGFQSCELQKRGSFTIWNTKAF